jgi:hypothetical protein
LIQIKIGWQIAKCGKNIVVACWADVSGAGVAAQKGCQN